MTLKKLVLAALVFVTVLKPQGAAAETTGDELVRHCIELLQKQDEEALHTCFPPDAPAAALFLYRKKLPRLRAAVKRPARRVV